MDRGTVFRDACAAASAFSGWLDGCENELCDRLIGCGDPSEETAIVEALANLWSVHDGAFALSLKIGMDGGIGNDSVYAVRSLTEAYGTCMSAGTADPNMLRGLSNLLDSTIDVACSDVLSAEEAHMNKLRAEEAAARFRSETAAWRKLP